MVRDDAPLRKRRVSRLPGQLAAGALAGAGAGALATVFELSALQTAGTTTSLVLVLAGLIIPAFSLGGVVLALGLALLRAAGALLARFRGWSEAAGDRTTALLSVPLVAPATYLLLSALAGGRKASALLGPLVNRALGAALLALLVALAVWVGLTLARALRVPPGGDADRRRSRRKRWAVGGVGIGLCASAFLLFQADDGLYQRLYLPLHFALLLGYHAAATLGLLYLARAIRPPHDEPPRTRRAGARVVTLLAVAALVGAALLARRALVSDQHLRYSAIELTTVSSKLLAIAPIEVRSESPLFLGGSPLAPRGKGKGGVRVPDANVILVSIDALRPDHLGAYGYGRPTSPNIDALAARSVRFENAYTQVPLTCYAVPSLHTGDYLRSTLPSLRKPPPTLARMLEGRGYTTAAFYNSSMFFCDDPKATGYGQTSFGFGYAETALRTATELTDQVLSYIQEFRASRKRKLFLWIHYFDVHEPYEQHPDHAFGSSKVDLYDGEIAYVDQAIGRLVAGAAELEGPTIFILTSDHGEEFKEHGGYYHGSSLYDEQIRVPLLIGVSGIAPRVDRSPAQLVDVVPTVLSLLGQRIPESVRGRSLVSSLAGRDEPDRPAFSEVHTKKMVRHGDWKLIHDFRRRTDELYHLAVDPRERQNLIARRPVEAARLRALLTRWFDQIRTVAAAEDKDRPEAVDLGRIGDRRAVPMLARLLLDRAAPSAYRTEAARLLGQLQDASVAESLWLAVGDDDERVSAESAIALGEIKDRRARVVLPQVVRSTDLDLRMRAGIALGRVDGKEATPALIQALYSSNWEIQNRAAHYLGFVGDRSALQPLLTASQLQHLRPRTCLSLGRLGTRIKDRRILDQLLAFAERDPHAEVRQRALAGLGFLGDRRAIRPLAKLLAEEPELIWAAEALARIGGIGSYWLPGLDFTPARRGLSKEGFGTCVNNATILIDDFHEATWCTMNQPSASVQLTLQRKPFAADLVLRLRLADARLRGTPLLVQVNGVALPPLQLRSMGWHSFHLRSEASHWRAGKNLVKLQLLAPKLGAAGPAGWLALDHLLLLPAEGATGGR